MDILKLRKRLNVYEAAGLIPGDRVQAVALLREAIEGGGLPPAEVVRHGIYSADMGGFLPGGDIDVTATIIERMELDKGWLPLVCQLLSRYRHPQHPRPW